MTRWITLLLVLAGCAAPTEALECTSDLDCPAEERCSTGVCGPPTDGPVDAGPQVASDAGSHAVADAGVVPDAGPQARPDAGVRVPSGPPPFRPPPASPLCMGTTTSTCACADGRDGERRCRSDDSLGACVCGDTEEDRIARVRGGIVGLWAGTRFTVWDGEQLVWVAFRADGTQGSECVGACLTFFWPEDGTPTPNRTYRIYDVTADDTGRGDLSFAYASFTRALALERITISADEDRMTFEARHDEIAHPLLFDLVRYAP
ncbi:MAG: hypothetical protein RMA76_10860 [Deltaproteobacteria bacterium]